MRLYEFNSPHRGGPGADDAYLLLNYDLDNKRSQAFISVHVTGLSEQNFQILHQAIEDQVEGFESLGRDLGLFDNSEINHASAESISRQQFPDMMYDLMVQPGPTITAGWLGQAADLPFQ